MKSKMRLPAAAAALVVFSGFSALALTVPVLYNASSSKPGLLTPASFTATSLQVAVNQITLLDFDLSNLNVVPASIDPGNVKSAILELYIINADPVGDLSLYPLTSQWNQPSASRFPSKAPLPTISTTLLATIPSSELPTTGKGFVSVDVTPAVVAALQSGSNLGIAIETSTPGARISLGSKDGTALGYGASLEIEAGLAGPAGPPGAPDKLTIGTVSSGTIPAITLTGTTSNQILNITLPQGPRGPIGPQGLAGPQGLTGPQGVTGPTGPSYSLQIGTVATGTTTTMTLTGTSPNQFLNFTFASGNGRSANGNTGIDGYGAFLMPYFNTDSSSALSFCASVDGQTYSPFGLPNISGTTYFRDPSILYLNGYYYVAYNTGLPSVGNDTVLGIIRATNLEGPWTQVCNYDFSSQLPGIGTLWTPNLENIGGNIGIYFTTYISGMPGNRLYYTAPASTTGSNAFTSFTTPVPITGTNLSASMIDPSVQLVSGTYYLMAEDLINGGDCILTSTNPVSGYTVLKSGRTWLPWAGEQPSLTYIGQNTWRITASYGGQMATGTCSFDFSQWGGFTFPTYPNPGYGTEGKVYFSTDIGFLRSLAQNEIGAALNYGVKNLSSPTIGGTATLSSVSPTNSSLTLTSPLTLGYGANWQIGALDAANNLTFNAGPTYSLEFITPAGCVFDQGAAFKSPITVSGTGGQQVVLTAVGPAVLGYGGNWELGAVNAGNNMEFNGGTVYTLEFNTPMGVIFDNNVTCRQTISLPTVSSTSPGLAVNSPVTLGYFGQMEIGKVNGNNNLEFNGGAIYPTEFNTLNGFIFDQNVSVSGNLAVSGTLSGNGSGLAALPITVLTGTLVSGTASLTDIAIYSHHPWVQPTSGGLNGQLYVTVSGSTATIQSESSLDSSGTSTFTLFVGPF